MAYKKKPKVTKKTVKKGPSTGGVLGAAALGLLGQFLGGYSTNLTGAAGGSVKKTTIKRVH